MATDKLKWRVRFAVPTVEEHREWGKRLYALNHGGEDGWDSIGKTAQLNFSDEARGIAAEARAQERAMIAAQLADLRAALHSGWWVSDCSPGGLDGYALQMWVTQPGKAGTSIE